MELLELVAKARDAKVKPAAVRRQNLIPAVCYGKGFASKSIELEYQAFRKAYKQASTTQVINLNIDGDKVPVLIHEIAYNPISDRFDHVDFLQIDLKKKVTANVPVELVGDAPAIKNFNAVLTLAKHEIEVKCLPMDIPHEIKVDVSKLENIGDVIHISDLQLGDRVEILDNLEETLVSVNEVEEFVEKEAAVPEELKAEPAAEGAEGGDKAEAAPAAEEKKE
jgi:large subunit ribosomal protein L25